MFHVCNFHSKTPFLCFNGKGVKVQHQFLSPQKLTSCCFIFVLLRYANSFGVFVSLSIFEYFFDIFLPQHLKQYLNNFIRTLIRRFHISGFCCCLFLHLIFLFYLVLFSVFLYNGVSISNVQISCCFSLRSTTLN